MQEVLRTLAEWVERVNDAIWGIPLILGISLVGIWLSMRLGFLQMRRLKLAFRLLLRPPDENSQGAVSAFGALTTSLAAMIGTGNIVGVATALAAGGPGAIVWMMLAALFGMATTYAEGLLAVKYRRVDANGHVLGGAFLYIERGMGRRFRPLAKIFAVFGTAAALLGIGTMTQVNGIAGAFTDLVDAQGTWVLPWQGMRISVPTLICAVAVTILVGIIIFGGIKRIARVSEFVVPVMGTLYVLATVAVLVACAKDVPRAVLEIVSSAFTGQAAFGGFSGALVARAVRMGVARGIFSNEAGLGSASIAAAAARTKWPAEQGLISMIGTFIDTVVLCTMTGIAIVVSGALETGLTGVALTNAAYSAGFPFAPGLGKVIVSVSLMFFAFTSILGWNYYGEQCLEYLGGRNRLTVYRAFYLLAIFIGCFLEINLVWNISDIFNGLMALPNLIALIALSGVVVRETRRYFAVQRLDER